MLLAFGFVLLLVFSLPAPLVLSPVTYHLLTLSHFFVFLISIIVFVLLGRSLAKRHRRFILPTFLVGLVTAFVGALAYQYVLRLPGAQTAFMSQLHGVPTDAALTMLHLHVLTGTLLIGLMAGIFYGVLGVFAAWWGGRIVRVHPIREPKEDPST